MTAGVDDQPQIAFQEHVTVVRLVVVGLIVLLVGRCFLAEPNHITTGSMAPHRLGIHRDWVCPDCQFRFQVGLRADGSSPAPICPNCGFESHLSHPGQGPVPKPGDHLWVMKNAFAFQQPKRWQEVVFYSPDDPSVPHLKRVAGLPGETVEIRRGDLFVNGLRVTKQSQDRKALSILVYDDRFEMGEPSRRPRWKFTGAEPDIPANDGARSLQGRNESSQVYMSQDVKGYRWSNYWHYCPARGAYGPVTDFLAYEGRDFGAEQVVSDLWFKARVKANGGDAIGLRLQAGDVRVMVELFCGGAGLREVRVWANGREISVHPLKISYIDMLKENDVELSWVDHRLECLVNGENVFEPIELEDLPEMPPLLSLAEIPAGIGVRESHATVSRFQLYRDIYITERPVTDPLIGYGVREPVRLPADGYFLLGDNSGYSLDSRFWRNGPVVPRQALIGRPLGRSNRE